MKIIIGLQRVLALITIAIGIVLTFAETPLNEGLSIQAWVTCGGIALVGVSLLWIALINWEDSCLETRKKIDKNTKRTATFTRA